MSNLILNLKLILMKKSNFLKASLVGLEVKNWSWRWVGVVSDQFLAQVEIGRPGSSRLIEILLWW